MRSCRLGAAQAVAEAAAERARQLGDRPGEALAEVVAAEARLQLGEEEVDELERRCREALPLFEQAGDHVAAGRVWTSLGYGVANLNGRLEEWAHAAEQAIHHWRLAGRDPHGGMSGLPAALLFGPRPADEALRTLDSALTEYPSSSAMLRRAQLLAMLGRFDEAWAVALPTAERMRELNGDDTGDFALGEIAICAGDHEAAVHWFRRYM